MPRQPIEATFYASTDSVSTSNCMFENTIFSCMTSAKHVDEAWLCAWVTTRREHTSAVALTNKDTGADVDAGGWSGPELWPLE